MYRLNAAIADSKYAIHIGSDVMHELKIILQPYKKILIVTDRNIQKKLFVELNQLLQNFACDLLVLEAGEEHKTWSSVNQILEFMHNNSYDRKSVLISFGGGVIGDIGGFAAAIYMRGVPWIQIPTTLLAQVDAAIGGKTGCNFYRIKNLIGCFYQPCAVFSETKYLLTLTDREYLNGMAEVIKCAFACDSEFFVWLEANLQLLKIRDLDTLERAIVQSCRIKLALVAKDPLDFGVRRHLNFGHTFGHAIEAVTNFREYLHGEAVAIGMMYACRIAVKMGLLARTFESRLYDMLSFLGLPTDLNDSTKVGLMYDYMLYDKKKHADELTLILPCALGEVRVVDGIKLKELKHDYVCI
jgi:3-dehydroquinate synthase